MILYFLFYRSCGGWGFSYSYCSMFWREEGKEWVDEVGEDKKLMMKL